ncbi:MAG TPA: hypothetical protein VHN14_10265 [Kofleriaceae bacterium]|jgi:hypothetical protein|nr:hypothetical protein [Kofleriaceae bacterium]
MTITFGSSRSCVQFCAYHGTFVLNGVNVTYGVIPDIGQAGCSTGCGANTVTNNTDSVASHELVEATTDPAVGLATTFAFPLAWYDQVNNGEIGDLCNGFGSGVAGIIDTKSAANVTDAQMQTELNRLFTAGTLSSPNADTCYPVHFPSGMAIAAPDGSKSCVQFCAYHGTYVRNGVNVNDGIIPDIGQAGCNAGCGGSTVTNNTDAVASHELVEAATDPAVGLATVIGPPLGWYDAVDNAELGDLCNGLQGSSSGFTVQKVWSNAACACVDR